VSPPTSAVRPSGVSRIAAECQSLLGEGDEDRGALACTLRCELRGPSALLGRWPASEGMRGHTMPRPRGARAARATRQARRHRRPRRHDTVVDHRDAHAISPRRSVPYEQIPERVPASTLLGPPGASPPGLPSWPPALRRGPWGAALLGVFARAGHSGRRRSSTAPCFVFTMTLGAPHGSHTSLGGLDLAETGAAGRRPRAPSRRSSRSGCSGSRRAE
jgi:hypothetical protein